MIVVDLSPNWMDFFNETGAYATLQYLPLGFQSFDTQQVKDKLLKDF